MVVHVASLMVNGHGAYILLLLSVAIGLNHTSQVVVILAIHPWQVVQVVAVWLHYLISMACHSIPSPRVWLLPMQFIVGLDSVPGIVSQFDATDAVGVLNGGLGGEVTSVWHIVILGLIPRMLIQTSVLVIAMHTVHPITSIVKFWEFAAQLISLLIPVRIDVQVEWALARTRLVYLWQLEVVKEVVTQKALIDSHIALTLAILLQFPQLNLMLNSLLELVRLACTLVGTSLLLNIRVAHLIRMIPQSGWIVILLTRQVLGDPYIRILGQRVELSVHPSTSDSILFQFFKGFWIYLDQVARRQSPFILCDGRYWSILILVVPLVVTSSSPRERADLLVAVTPSPNGVALPHRGRLNNAILSKAGQNVALRRPRLHIVWLGQSAG